MNPTALVVQARARQGESIAGWLEDAGFEVMACPGPLAPSYECVGGRQGRCQLIAPADVVVVDLRLAGEAVMDGTAVAELLALYTSSGKPVVIFGPDPSIAGVFAGGVDVAPWPPTAHSLVRSVLGALSLEGGELATPGSPGSRSTSAIAAP